MNEEGEGVLEGEVRLEVEEKTVDEEGMVSFVESKSKAPVLSPSSPGIEGFTKRVREMSSQLFVTLYALCIYPSTHKQLGRHLPKPFCKFPCRSSTEKVAMLQIKSTIKNWKLSNFELLIRITGGGSNQKVQI